MMKPKTAARVLLAAGVLFLGAAVFPLTRGGSVNTAFLLIAGALVVIAPVVRRTLEAPDSKPPAA